MRRKKNVFKFLMLFALTLIGVNCSPDQKVFAAGTPVEICAVSYADESILVFNNGNTKIYFATESDASKNTWDVVDVTAGKPITVIDISWLSPNVENILVVKGNGDPTQRRIIITDRPQKLEVSINYIMMEAPNFDNDDQIGSLLNIMASEGDGKYPITIDDLEWKKGDNGHWMSSDTLTKGLLNNYLIKGTYIYFRIAPVDDVVDATVAGLPVDLSVSTDMYAYTKPTFKRLSSTGSDVLVSAVTFGDKYPDGTKGMRASNEVKLKVTKMASLPVTGIDGSEFNVSIKYGKEYRVTVDGSSTPILWTQVNDRLVKKLPLATMIKAALPSSTYDGISSHFPKMLIEIRGYATTKAAATKITETSLEAQRELTGAIITGVVPSDATSTNLNIYLAYNGTKNMTVTIPSASVDNPYEFCVVKKGASFDLERASWTTISKNTSFKILSSKAVDYGKLYIRMKEVKYKAATNTSAAITYKLASTLKTFDINYPSMPVATKMTYIYTKGYSTEIKITVALNVIGKIPFETSLKYLKLGTKDVSITSATVNHPVTGVLNPALEYKMEIILNGTALETMTNCTARALGIYYGNNIVDKTSSKLTIKSPSSAPSLTATPAPGAVTSGATAVTVINAPGSDNSFVYSIDPAVISGKTTEDTMTTGLAFTSGMDITVPVGQYLTIYEINTATKKIVRYKSIQITSAYIKP